MRRFDNFFDDFFGLSVPDRPLLGDFGISQLPTNFMRTDVVEKDGAYELTVDLPGFKKEDIDITLEDNVLTVTAETKTENEEKKDDKYIRRERYVGKQSRRMFVPEGVKKEDVKAAFKDGVLTIDIPKPEKVEPEKKSIDIE